LSGISYDSGDYGPTESLELNWDWNRRASSALRWANESEEMEAYRMAYTGSERKSFTLWDVMTCSPLQINRCFGGTYHLHIQDRRISEAVHAICFMLVSCVAYSLTLKMEAIYFPETSVEF
jgi:hypothetical protein